MVALEKVQAGGMGLVAVRGSPMPNRCRMRTHLRRTASWQPPSHPEQREPPLKPQARVGLIAISPPRHGTRGPTPAFFSLLSRSKDTCGKTQQKGEGLSGKLEKEGWGKKTTWQGGKV